MDNLIHKSVTATYKMFDITEGVETVLEETSVNNPLKLITDMGMMPITVLEDKLKKATTGETFQLTLTPEEGFGEYVAERVVDIDKQVFCVNGDFDKIHIREGVIVPLQSEDGQRFMAQVVRIGDEKVTIDLNHPLAGKTLRFNVEIIEAHDATDEEIMSLLNQMNHHGCGGCSGNCSGGCSGDCGGSCGGDCSNSGCGDCKHNE